MTNEENEFFHDADRALQAVPGAYDWRKTENFARIDGVEQMFEGRCTECCCPSIGKILNNDAKVTTWVHDSTYQGKPNICRVKVLTS